MILDAELQFCSGQAVTAAAASTNIVDQGVANRDIGTGEDLYLVVGLSADMTDAGSNSDVDVALRGDSTSTITPDATKTMFNFPAGSLAGTQKIAKLSPGEAVLQYRYLDVYFTPNNGNLTTGTFYAYITNNISKATLFPNNSTIS